MEMSTAIQNIQLLEEILSGKDYSDCAKKLNVAVSSVSAKVRAALHLLREHTDIDVMESGSYGYVWEMKDEIKKYLKEPLPKTSITPSARTYLRQKFGKYYARIPENVAAEWLTINNAFNRFTQRRDLESIQKWLASENCLVGNVVTDDMLNFAWEAFAERLHDFSVKNDKHDFVVNKVERSGWKTKVIVHATLKQDEHEVERRFAIDLIPI